VSKKVEAEKSVDAAFRRQVMAQNVEIGDLLANRSGGTHGGAGCILDAATGDDALAIERRVHRVISEPPDYVGSNELMLAPVSSTTGITSDERPSAASRRRSTTMDETAGSKTTRGIRK
jgi:hypothetical protein